MNQQILKMVRALVGIVVLLYLFFTIRGWWTEYKVAPKPSGLSVETTDTANGESGEGAPGVPAEGTLVVQIAGLNLRDKPAIDGAQIRGLEKNEKLSLIKRQGDWYYVSTTKDEEGWISANKSYTNLQKKK